MIISIISVLACTLLFCSGCFDVVPEYDAAYVTSERDIASLIRGWGQHSCEYDRAIVDAILDSQNDVHWMEIDHSTGGLLLHRIREKPVLLKRMFGEYRESLDPSAQPRASDRKGFVVALADDLANEECSTGRRFVWILLLASMLDRPQWVIDLEWTNIEVRWMEIVSWLEENSQYCEYDDARGAYWLNEDARAAGIPVSPGAQVWTGSIKPESIKDSGRE